MPGATEDFPWDDVAWKVRGKAFVFTSQGSNRISVKSSLKKQAMLIVHPNISIAAYVGRFGWVTVEITDEDTLEFAKELIAESFLAVASGHKRKKA